jgi:transposase
VSKTYSKDFRKRVFEIKEKENLTYQGTSERFGTNIRSLFRWKKTIPAKDPK